METLILDANKSKNIGLCADVIKRGGAVAFPTETVYGLGADALNEAAVEVIFSIKGRQKDNPLIVHIASIYDVKPLVSHIPDLFELLAGKFWPGPLTLIMQKSNRVPYNVTAGLDTVAVRMPEHPAALALIKSVGCPIAAPSANPSGKPSPTKASHVKNDIGGKIPYILDGGDCKVGLESTVLDISGDIPRILRPGYVTYNELKEFLGDSYEIESEVSRETAVSGSADSEESETPISPGMKYRHYAPKAPLTAVIGPPDETFKYISVRIGDDAAALMFDDYAFSHPNVVTYGFSEDHIAQASSLFDAIRKTDSINASVIYAQVPKEDGLGTAVANRIKKAAGKNIVYL